MFLQLMVAQMRNQDPANPTDSSAFLAQTAQFTALEKMQAVADQTSQLVALQVAFGASSMVGRTVSYAGADGEMVSGLVSSVRFEATGPVLQVDGEDVHFAQVQSLGDGSTELTDLTDPAGELTDPVARPSYLVA
jgi:flagellar basal-body rod modification protein FlgD